MKDTVAEFIDCNLNRYLGIVLIFGVALVVLTATPSAQAAGFNVNTEVTLTPLTSTYRTTAATAACPSGFAGKFTFTALLTNKAGSPAMPGVVVRVLTLTNGNVLLDPQTNVLLGGAGAEMAVPKVGQYADGLLSPGETIDVPFVICLKTFQQFGFFVDVFGVVTKLVSVNAAGTRDGNNWSSLAERKSISGDGRFIAFNSIATDLVPNDTNGLYDVFVRDLQTNTTTLVSLNLARTTGGNERSLIGEISANGRFIAFLSDASNLVAGDTNAVRDVFLRDLQTRTTTLVSVNRFGSAGGNNRSTEPVISPDGRFIAFISDASDLVANDTNATTDVFVRDLHTGVTTLVSINSAGTDAGNAQSGYMLGISGHKLSADGRFVLFMSDASDLVPNDSNGLKDVFVHDLQTRTTTLVSINRFGTNSADKAPSRPDISADGRFVVFDSQATDLLVNDTNGKSDVFVRDLQTGTTTLVSVNRFGTNGGDDDSIQAQLSANGRFVAFWSSATDLVANQTGRYNVFVRDLQTRTTLQVPVPGDVYDAPKLSANGRFVVVKILGDRGTYELFVHDLQTATSALVSANIAGARSGNYIDDFDISADGRFVVFDALSGGALTTIPATYGTRNVYVRPVQ